MEAATCPPGYVIGGTCPGNGLCCRMGWTAGVNSEKVCKDAGAKWIPLDPCCNPYTCEVPIGIQIVLTEKHFKSKFGR